MHKFTFGQWARDAITGFEGIVMARVEFYTGCTQYALQPVVDEKNKFELSNYFDETRLVLLPYKGRVALPSSTEETPGADIAPPRA